MNYLIITENDESIWEDKTGTFYNFPNRYKEILLPGTHVIYYKGKMRSRIFRESRLTDEPHYFGVAEVGNVYPDIRRAKKDWFCDILDFKYFSKPVPIKINQTFIENIPDSRKSNYWRDGVRKIPKNTFDEIIRLSGVVIFLGQVGELESFAKSEGEKKLRYTTYYERQKANRDAALRIHGFTCMVCKFNFEQQYGELGKGFIHVHHNKPVSDLKEPQIISPKEDLSVVCPNCHAMIHKLKDRTLTIQELKDLLPK